MSDPRYRRVAGFCALADRPVLEQVWQWAFDWSEGGQFGVPYSDDEGVTNTHNGFYDAACDRDMAMAWDDLQDGVIPPPLAGAWGQGGLPSEQDIETARGSLRINILPVDSEMEPLAHMAAAAQQFGLVKYE